MRWLKLTTPHTKDPAVGILQGGLNDLLGPKGYHPPLDIDCELGPLTARAVAQAKSLIGFPRKHVHDGASPRLQRILRGEEKVPRRWRARATYRWSRVRLARRRAAKRRGHGVKRALQLAHKAVNDQVAEHPPGSNDGPFLETHFPRFGWHPGYAWCQYLCDWLLWASGGPLVPSGYTPTVAFNWASRGLYGLRRVPLADRKPGDWIYYKWAGISHDPCDHVGLYIGDNKTIEGNTSPGLAGSQNNGGVVALKEFGVDRSLTQVVACVRPTYHR